MKYRGEASEEINFQDFKFACIGSYHGESESQRNQHFKNFVQYMRTAYDMFFDNDNEAMRTQELINIFNESENQACFGLIQKVLVKMDKGQQK